LQNHDGRVAYRPAGTVYQFAVHVPMLGGAGRAFPLPEPLPGACDMLIDVASTIYRTKENFFIPED